MTASAGAWYRVGTVNVTNGSAAIVGVGSNWQNDVIAIAIGDAFTIDAKTWYEVIAVNSDTSITIDRPFEGTTENTKEYAILRNTSGTILTRLAGQIAVQFNQKQLFLDELRNWLTSDDETATLTDSHGIEHVVKTVNKIQELTGTAAYADKVVSSVDTTAGRLLTAGYAGIGSSSPNATPVIFSDIDNTEVINGFSRRAVSQSGTLPSGFGNTAALVFQQAWDSATKFQQYVRAASGIRIAWRARVAGTWEDYVEAYHSGNTNFNEFYPNTVGGVVAVGEVLTSNVLRFYLPINSTRPPTGLTVTSAFRALSKGTIVEDVTSSITLNSGLSSPKLAVVDINGENYTTGHALTLRAASSDSKITVNF